MNANIDEISANISEALKDFIFDKKVDINHKWEESVAREMTERMKSLAEEGNLYIPGDDGIPVKCTDGKVTYDAENSSLQVGKFQVLATIDSPPVQRIVIDLHAVKGEY